MIHITTDIHGKQQATGAMAWRDARPDVLRGGCPISCTFIALSQCQLLYRRAPLFCRCNTLSTKVFHPLVQLLSLMLRTLSTIWYRNFPNHLEIRFFNLEILDNTGQPVLSIVMIATLSPMLPFRATCLSVHNLRARTRTYYCITRGNVNVGP